MNDRLIYVAKSYELVIGDEFQMFYRGIIRSMNPYKYYIYCNCAKGRAYPRYFTYTPKEGDEGEYKLRICLYDDFMNLIEEAETTLVVNKIEKVKGEKLNILCLGDSLTFNGVWPAIGCMRFEDSVTLEGDPKSYGMGDNFNFVGTMKKEIEYENCTKVIGYEGYGGWQWRHFVLNETVDAQAGVWVEYKNNPFTENDQHSVWMSNNKKWVLESIEKDRIKFKRGNGNWGITADIGREFVNLEGGVHKDTFSVEKYEFEKGNPFFYKDIDGIDFKRYCKDIGIEKIDYLYILLSWNGQYIPFNHDHSRHEEFMVKLIDKVHEDFKDCKVRLLGIQSCYIDGGMASNYGANGPYHDVFGELSTAFFYNEFLESFCFRIKYASFMRYIDTKAMIDVENNMPHFELPVNARSKKTELIGSNGVHLTMDGYKQVGDVFFRNLVADVIRHNKGEN